LKEATKMGEMGLKEIFEGMVKGFDAEEAKGWKTVIQYDITGEGGGKFYIEVKDQKCSLGEGVVENPKLTITISTEDWFAIVEGRLEGQEAFMTGKMKAEGDMNDLFRMASTFRTKGE